MVIVEGLPAGLEITVEEIQVEMASLPAHLSVVAHLTVANNKT